MASKAHQVIAALVARKMREEGYEVVMFEGKEVYVSDIKLKMPPKIKKHRPDLVGYNLFSKDICIGEAKTSHDLSTLRTRNQIKDFSGIVLHSNRKVKFFIGVPTSGLDKLKKMLDNYGIQKEGVVIINVPDRLL